MAFLIPLLVLQILSAEAFFHYHRTPASARYSRRSNGEDSNPYTFETNGDAGTPLFLTPYIESGKIEEAQNLARVNLPGLPDLISYAGFFTVDKTLKSNIFVWYFPTLNRHVKDGLATFVWLQGGPGASSLYGLFNENGPINVTNNKEFKRRPIHWNEYFNLIYIDNPVGTGFSYTEYYRGYSTNQTQIGEHLYQTMVQFYKLFPKLQARPLIISGESYGGKYATSLAYTIHKKNPTAKSRGDPEMPLAGVTIGDGWCDPINQLDYGNLAYQAGLITPEMRDYVEMIAEETRQLIKNEKWSKALQNWDTILDVIEVSMTAVSVYNYGRLDQFFNKNDELNCSYCELLNEDSTRKAIHVGNLTYKYMDIISEIYLYKDFMKSVAPWISELLEHYQVLIYNGQLDLIVGYSLTNDFIRHLDWSGKAKYENNARTILFDIPEHNLVQIAFYKNGGNLTDSMIREAGHMAPADQPDFTKSVVEVWMSLFVLNDKVTKSYYSDILKNIKLEHRVNRTP